MDETINQIQDNKVGLILEDPNNVTDVSPDAPFDIFPNQIPIRTMNDLISDRGEDFTRIGSNLVPIAKTIDLASFSGSDFTNAQHNHADSIGGGQLNPSTALASAVPVSKGGTGAATLTGILLGSGTSAITTIVPLAGTKVYYVSDSSGGAVNRKLTFTNGVLTSET